ncbi:MAG: transglycosylase domain-containing protein [Lentihominibacter sp.]
MPDNNRNNYNRDDIDDFFAQFDEPQSKQSRPRSGSRTQSRSERSRSQHGHAQKQRNETRRKPASDKRPAPPVRGGAAAAAAGSPKATVLKVLLLVILAAILAVGIYTGILFLKAPSINTDDIYSTLSQRSIMYDSEGNEIENLYFSDGNRTIVSYDSIPEDMVNAVVSIEDKKFWKHSGFNYIRMLGAVKDSIFGGGGISGTSTVTQQLARNIYLSEIKSQRSLSRKITEAYITILLEKNLTKEQIMEAYLNSIYLGFNSYGIQAAAQAYFSKDVSELDTLECASLAALPQSPDTYALVQADYYNSDTSLPQLSKTSSVTYLYNGDLTSDRRNLVLQNMYSEGFITESELNECLNDDLKDHIKVGVSSDADETSYFTDYAIEQLTDDIVSEYGVDESQALSMIYTGGLKIYTTMDSDIQNILEEEFDESDNFAGVAYTRTDSEGNILNSSSGDIMLYSYSHYFNSKDEFTLTSDEYEIGSDGSMTILAGKRLNIYQTEVNGEPDVSIEFKSMYENDNGVFYCIKSGALSIPQGYKTVDDNGNVIISAQFFEEYPEFFRKDGSDYIVTSDNYSLQQKTRQPQGAMVIMENSTGEVKAMMGGRGTKGKQLYNRAVNPRQPGSSIKPIGVYGPALQMSFEYERDGKTMTLDTSEGSDWGKYITAGSIINDAPISNNGSTWPKNWYNGYRGHMTLRKSVQQSVNVCAVKTYQQIGPDYSSSMLKKVGISTIDEEGDVNDLNPAALALGGMTSGISPLELAAAYAVFPNGGTYKEPITYTKVLGPDDELLFDNKSKEEQVYDEGVAWIMTDILRTVVTQGIATNANIGSQPVGGKTGTTDNQFDIWFCGFTPQYTAALWMGNDVNIEVSAGSSQTASFWAEVMSRVCENIPYASFREKPDNVISVGGEYYTDGTYSRVISRATKTKSSETETTEPSTTTEPPTQTVPSTTVPPVTEPVTEPSEHESTSDTSHTLN